MRALTIRAARPAAAPELIRQFVESDDSSELGIRWVIANAISVVADDSMYEQVEGLVKEKRYGRSREMFVLWIGKSRNQRAEPLLLELLKDDDVLAQAIRGLGRRKGENLRAAIEPFLTHPRPLVRSEAKSALRRLPS